MQRRHARILTPCSRERCSSRAGRRAGAPGRPGPRRSGIHNCRSTTVRPALDRDHDGIACG
ncbi:excalibur calcium-binding domain-containing protein [Pseudonocardia phyllosphaerae]|uniref:excalibur calcium-binding domain-containing protein n=1 Tax=Pseudonocardia phyllosphaerae TaxID=3390502 RepID=UPI00397AA196